MVVYIIFITSYLYICTHSVKYIDTPNMEHRTQSYVDKEVFCILLNALNETIKDTSQQILSYVTPLIEYGAIRLPMCNYTDSMYVKKRLLRLYIGYGNKDGFFFHSSISCYLNNRRNTLIENRSLNFRSFTRRTLGSLSNRNILRIRSGNQDLTSLTMTYDDGICDFADFETIFFLLTPRYKDVFSYAIKKNIDIETQCIFGDHDTPVTLKNTALSIVNNTYQTSFVTFPTSTNEDQDKIYLGRQLLFFEEYVIQNKYNSRYVYSGRFPLHLLGLMRKTSVGYPTDCTVFIEEDCIKENIKDFSKENEDSINNRRTLISTGKVSSVLSKDNIIRYFIYSVCSDIGYTVGNGFQIYYFYNIIIVKNLDEVINSIMCSDESIYELNIHRTIALGPIVRLNGYRVGIHVMNHDIHIGKKDIVIPSDSDLRNFSCKKRDKCCGIFYQRKGDTTKRRRKRYIKLSKQFSKRNICKINNVYRNIIVPPNLGGLMIKKWKILYKQFFDNIES